MNIKIAVIDVGISKKFDQKINIEHFRFFNGQIVNEYKKPLDSHGDLCLEEILKQKTEIDILDINISDNVGKPQLSGMIRGIKKAIEERVDIINISLGLTEYSEELYKICEEAINNNISIIAAASHSDDISYPADFKNVLSIKVDKDPENEIKKIDDSTLSIYRKEAIVTFKNSSVALNTTSMASAYFSGILGKALGNNPIYDKFTILQKSYDINLDKSKSFVERISYESCELHKRIKEKKVAVVLLPSQQIQNISLDIKLENVIAFYDHNLKDFYSFKNPQKTEKDFDTILIINTQSDKAKILNEIKNDFKNCEIICIGEFESANSYEKSIYKHENFVSENISTLDKPVILISALSSNLNKFDIQTNIVENFTKNEVQTKAITYNPKGALYGFDIFEYPSKVIFPDIVCSINNYMCAVEDKTDIETWVINVGGGCFFINNQNKNNFGRLVSAYLDACNVDVFILCINSFANIEAINFYILKLKNMGIKNVIIFFSENNFDLSSLNAKDGLNVYKMDNNSYAQSLEYLKNNIDAEIFNASDLENNKLYESIIKTLTIED